MKNYRDETILLRAGYEIDKSTNSVAVPIYQTTSYKFNSQEHAANLFGLKEFGNIYTRLMNPTTDVLEKRVAALECGVGALALSSGQSAITLAILNIAEAGDEIISLDNLYGGTYSLFKYTFKKLGIKVHFVSSSDIDAIKALINSKTKAIYCETIGNPKLNVTDLQKLSNIAHSNSLPLIVDNTLAPFICKPIEHGADIVVYSATKFLGGHGTSLGGVIVDSGKFDWGVKDGGEYKFPLIAAPEPSYHGVEFIEALKPMGNISYIIKARVTLLRDMGMAISPHNSFLLIQGLETLHIRMERHSLNAKLVADFLQKHPKISWVNYPGVEDSKEHKCAKAYLKNSFGAIIGAGIVGGYDSAVKFIDNLELLLNVANVGDAKSLVIHPASTTHSQLSDDDKRACGVNDEFVRFSIGIENIDDIIDDISQALDKI